MDSIRVASVPVIPCKHVSNGVKNYNLRTGKFAKFWFYTGAPQKNIAWFTGASGYAHDQEKINVLAG